MAEVAKRHSISEQSIYGWRKHYGEFGVDELRRFKATEAGLTLAHVRSTHPTLAARPTTQTAPQAPVLQAIQQSYTLTGDVPWRPKGVWDDGRTTVIEMPQSIPAESAPVLLIVKPTASGEKAISYRMDGSRYLIDGLFERAVLVTGSGYYRQSVMIERRP